jgi:hypothetical protein
MAAKKRAHSPGGSVGKNPAKRVKTDISQVKHTYGSAAPHRKKGGIIRRPKPKI